MQWTPDRNGGFSTADPQRMYLPLNQDPVYGYQVTNVESQLRNTNSLLQWIRRMIQVRNEHPTFGLGTLRGGRLAQPDGAVVRARVRRRRRAVRQQPVPVPAAGGAGPAPVRGLHADRADRPGGVPADRRPARTCSRSPGTASTGSSCPSRPSPRPTSTRTGSSATSSSVADSLLAAGVVSAAEETPGDNARRPTIRRGTPMKALTDLFREWMPHQRWFGGKGREWADVSEDGFFLDRGNPVLSVHRVRVTYTDGARGDLPGAAVLARPPGRGPRVGVRRRGAQRRTARPTPTTRCATGTRRRRG